MRLIILGAGAFGKTVRDIAEQSGKYDTIAFLDDDCKDDSAEVLGKLSDFKNYIDDNTEFLVAIGDNELRYSTIEAISKNEGKVGRLVHSSAYVSPTATVGIGTIILPNASVGTDVVISYGCIINMGAVIDHKVILGVGVHVAPGAIIKGENVIDAFTKVESGEVIQRGQFPIADSSML